MQKETMWKIFTVVCTAGLVLGVGILVMTHDWCRGVQCTAQAEPVDEQEHKIPSIATCEESELVCPVNATAIDMMRQYAALGNSHEVRLLVPSTAAGEQVPCSLAQDAQFSFERNMSLVWFGEVCRYELAVAMVGAELPSVEDVIQALKDEHLYFSGEGEGFLSNTPATMIARLPDLAVKVDKGFSWPQDVGGVYAALASYYEAVSWQAELSMALEQAMPESHVAHKSTRLTCLHLPETETRGSIGISHARPDRGLTDEQIKQLGCYEE